ncbi:acyltransferase family protein [Modestobacter sp. VKM Ac-2985]|uniref:acyltransferase family protein n=1 Tax=Modestobacter sp. VKM Ac-2985 TaxID=3004139 RepID=UPI0022AB7E04|nr:acyltransferase [Modestobacter sp. VKM Ac-2985]MCZ2836438.1 acyltransferase [Modestobacter sp. VKM Ac-2985]
MTGTPRGDLTVGSTPATGGQPAAPPARLGHRPELDGVRAVAVLLVLVHHVLQPTRFAGFLGVDVFFVLSGFLITTLLVEERRRSGRIRLGTFWLRRALRLYPALLLLLVVWVPVWVWHEGSLLHQLRNAVVAGSYTGNLYMTYTGEWLGPLAHTWSLALEEQYYLVWPLVLVVGVSTLRRTRGLLGLVLAGTAVTALVHLAEYRFGTASFPIESTAVGLLAGSALALVLVSATAARARAVLGAPVTGPAGALLLLAVLPVFSLTTALPDGAYTLLAVVGTVLLVGGLVVRRGDRLNRALSVRPVVWLGRVSYGVYLWHYPLVLLVADLRPDWSPWARLTVVLGLSVLAAAASHRWVEQPFLRLKDRVGGAAGAPVSPTPAPVAPGARA